MLNPLVVDGQIRGAVAQGVGAALLEQCRLRRRRRAAPEHALRDYLLPTAVEVPQIEIDHLSSPSPYTPDGVKGMGESGMIATPAAVAPRRRRRAQAPGRRIDRTPRLPAHPSRADRGAHARHRHRSGLTEGAVYTITPMVVAFGPQREKSRFTYMHNFGDKVDIPYVSWLIRGEGRNILVDAGCSADDYKKHIRGDEPLDARGRGLRRTSST